MATVYENINTFQNDIGKNDLREKIFNPLIIQHNNMCLDITNFDDRINLTEASIHDIVEKLDAILARLDALETPADPETPPVAE